MLNVYPEPYRLRPSSEAWNPPKVIYRWPRVRQGERNPGPGGATGGLNNYISANANGKPNPQANMFFDI